MQHYSDQRDNGYVILHYAEINRRRVKFFVNHHADPVDDAPHQDGEAAYMVERQAGKPAIIEAVSEIER